MTEIITHMSEISDRYDLLFCDLWGCVHNGYTPFPDAVAALQAFRAKGGTVILVTNAPRPRGSVQKQLDRMGLPRDSYDDIATSGDSARSAMFRGAVGDNVYFIGEPHDQPFFEPLALEENPVTITQVPLDQAEGIVCCGPFDPLTDPEVNRPDFLYAKQKGLKLLCANPDIVVDRGESREWCAGALARLYTEMGGESLYFGKPHPPIYDLARRRTAALGKDISDALTLCVGDGIITDIQGAVGEDLDSLFITGGLAAKETETRTQPETQALKRYLSDTGFTPTYSIGFLR
ncbi:MAG: TIGR01459 family HAD-type hydrolase [Pseudomonadota bacterium]